ncbi:amino acid permease [Azotosporobacter soli]|uniref:amino acid permease n=1 Tax=Azotosporobacter soli TaxID=3055040 RepID=UPI0031FEA04A
MMKENENSQPEEGKQEGLRADLGLVSALSLVVGMVLGAGAFMKPPAVLAAAGDFNLALAAWAIGGLFSIAGGLTLCELGVLFPQTGGIFVYLEKLYGPRVSFLYGWMLSVIFGPALIGALTGYFSSVFCLLFNIPDAYSGVVGAAALAFIAIVNSVGVKEAGYLQTLATFCKLIPIIMLTVFGLFKGSGQVALFSASGGAINTAAPFSVAILATLFAYDGWAQVASVAGEIKNPSKILPKAIIGGVAFLIVVYISINVAMFKMFPVSEMVALGHDASSIAAQKMFGLVGGNLIAVGIMISILGGLNGYIMTLSRNIYIMGQRGQIFGASVLSKIDQDSNSPVNAIVMLVVSSYFYYRLLDADKLSDIAMFSIWLFYLLAFIGIFIARKKYADMVRTYKVPLYPLVPLIAIGGALYVIYGMLSNQFLNGIISIALTLAGLPVYYYLRRSEHGIGWWPNFKTKYIMGLASLLIIGLLTLSVHVFDNRQEIHVAVVPAFEPFTYEDQHAKLTGFDIELMNIVAEKSGVKVRYEAVALESIFEAVNNGAVDAAVCSLSVTPERQKNVTFTKPYIETGGLALLTRRGDTADLSGKTIAVPGGSTSETFARSIGNTAKVQVFQSNKDMIKAFNQGWVDAIVFDKLILEHFVAKKMIEKPVTMQNINREEYAIAFSAKNKAMGEKFNKVIAEMKKNGELEALYEKWFGENQHS